MNLRLDSHLREYSIRLAAPGDEARIQALLESDPAYFGVTQGAPPSPTEAKDQLSDLPAGKEYRDKLVYAIFDCDETLVALVDLVRGYPDDETWFLGLLFVAPACRNTGLGSRPLDAIFAEIKQQGARAIRLGVVRGNVRARALYDRSGFRFVYERERVYPNGFAAVIDVLERSLR
jgi:ribosomal protein S18 acetylase RimI-like enzyme